MSYVQETRERERERERESNPRDKTDLGFKFVP